MASDSDKIAAYRLGWRTATFSTKPQHSPPAWHRDKYAFATLRAGLASAGAATFSEMKDDETHGPRININSDDLNHNMASSTNLICCGSGRRSSQLS